MSETLKWAHDLRDGRLNRHTLVSQMHLLAEAMIADADTSPASQERDEDGLLERATERAACDPRHAEQHATETLVRIQRILEQPKGSIGKRKILRECRGAIVALLARPRGGNEGVLNALINVSGRDLLHPDGPCWCPEGRGGADHTVACERARRLVARLRSGSEREPRYFGLTANIDRAVPHDLAARPSGGEGAPEPDGWVPMTPAGPKWGSFSRKRREAEYYGDGIRGVRAVYLRPPPEREACSTCTEGEPPYFCRECVHRREEGLREALEREAEAREPDAMTYTKDPRRYLAEWSEVLAVRRFDPEKCKTDGSGPPWPVFFGTPGPAREAEIRADERRKGDEALSTAARAEKLAWLDAMDEGCPPDVAQGAQHAIEQLLARLSPTDEQESPNRSDEP